MRGVEDYPRTLSEFEDKFANGDITVRRTAFMQENPG